MPPSTFLFSGFRLPLSVLHHTGTLLWARVALYFVSFWTWLDCGCSSGQRYIIWYTINVLEQVIKRKDKVSYCYCAKSAKTVKIKLIRSGVAPGHTHKVRIYLHCQILTIIIIMIGSIHWYICCIYHNGKLETLTNLVVWGSPTKFQAYTCHIHLHMQHSVKDFSANAHFLLIHESFSLQKVPATWSLISRMPIVGS